MTEDLDRHFRDLTRCRREQSVRSGKLQPRNDDERRQAAEGPREWAQLDAMRQEETA